MSNRADEQSGIKINEKATISLTLVITGIISTIGLFGSFAMVIRWGTIIEQKLDEGLRNQATQLLAFIAAENKNTEKFTVHTKEIAEMKARLAEHEKFGTPALQGVANRLSDVEKLFKKN